MSRPPFGGRQSFFSAGNFCQHHNTEVNGVTPKQRSWAGAKIIPIFLVQLRWHPESTGFCFHRSVLIGINVIDRYFLKQPLLRRFFTRILAGNREETVTLLAREYRVHTIREHGLLRASRLADTCSLYRDETSVLIHLAGLISDGDTFLDIGANIGIFAVNIARLGSLYPNLRVYAFEPNRDTAARLRANAEPLGVKVLNVALSDRNGTLEFVHGAVSNVFTTVPNASSYSIRQERSVCECRRLDDCQIEGDSIVMKVDVEGQELEVLQGSSSYFHLGRVKAVYLDDYKDPGVREFLDAYGFCYYNGRTCELATESTRHLLAVKPHQLQTGIAHSFVF